MDYYQFEAEDLAADDYFKEWVCSPDEESDAFWNSFLRDYPERYYHIEEGRQLVLGLSGLDPVLVPSEQLSRIWSRVEATVSGPSLLDGRGSRRIIWTVAASILLVLGIGWTWLSRGLLGDDAPAGAVLSDSGAWVETVSGRNDEHALLLPDGSRVRLGSASKLRYPKQFDGDRREVYLTGEAFFEVTKNPKRPFLVYANGLVTKVLGTSFSIQARDHEPEVTVAVKTGRVSVYSARSPEKSNRDPETRGIVLMPNQKAVYLRETSTLSKTLVEKPEMQIHQSSAQARFVFEDAPAGRVFEALEKLYGVEVIFDEELLRNCTVTIDLDDEDLFQKLEVICRVLDLNYKLIDAQVIIYGNGCQ
ncbi:hypothetical protein DYBT9275_05667 [Dyadobacter sp. CECT 9275]|uniref:FecR family protein n=1 Tax=Dyadobacter helix TaxID=2822344 RepID=A0A916JHZ8_9BACT|nr:FecR family protein [Dyadobacter sp. CECT 9275]CAG5016935.1 hypothetical protein DYBT9275_05667 [Dyadobacter sp. CECT 9275]